MQSNINFFIIFAALAVLTSVNFAQETVTSPQESVSAGEAQAVSPSFPYIAEIIAGNVNIRSGPGTNYYPCGKLNRTDRVKVVASKFSWSQIVPPAGSFSWISKQYVSVDQNNPAAGIVTGDNVRVYAGSDRLKPMHSTTLQPKRNKGDRVRLLGEEKDDYYKIAPPDGAYLWISTEYTEPLGSVGQIPLTVAPQSRPKADTTAAPLTEIAVEADGLKEYYALQRQIKAEQAKPLAQQDYTNIKKVLIVIANNKAAGKAARYAGFAIKQIDGFKLALKVDKEIQLSDEQLQKIKQQIEKNRAEKLSQVQELGKFAVIGRFQTFVTYGPGHYRIIDDSDKTVCYALPSGSAGQMDLGKLIGRKVGLVGTIQPHLQTAGAIVKFTEIVELN